MSRKAKIWLLVLLVFVVTISVTLWILPTKFEAALRATVNDYLREKTLAMLDETDVAGLNVEFGT